MAAFPTNFTCGSGVVSMVFSAPVFLFGFLPLTLLIYCILPRQFRNGWLTSASLLFYAWGELAFLPILVASVVFNYYFALWIDQTRGTPLSKSILIVGIASDLLLLLYFKYADFLVGSLNFAGEYFHLSALELPQIALPLGISFFTFHKISYKVDVYRGDAAAKRNPLDLALYILFFPQLIAGPIVRYNEVAGQITSKARALSLARFSRGATIFVIGLAKKTLLANTFAVPADQIFALPTDDLSALVAWFGILCYALQIYFDFAGYSDMAIGIACIFGFDFPANFNYPYIADSITDFWRRWHMSLSRWFRDYLYIPLGGNRVSGGRTYFNLVTVFFLCGLWHGAAWTFVAWGLFHGAFLVLERAFLGRWLAAAPKWLRHIYLILVVLVGWTLFRSDSLSHASGYFQAMLGLTHPPVGVNSIYTYFDSLRTIALPFALLAATPFYLIIREKMGIPAESAIPENTETPVARVWGAELIVFTSLSICLGLSLLSVAGGAYDPFIYFRF